MDHFAYHALKHLEKHPIATLDGRTLTILSEELEKGIKEHLWLIGVLEENDPDNEFLQEFKDELKTMADHRDAIASDLRRRRAEYEANSGTASEG